jgi:hypothetical protein
VPLLTFLESSFALPKEPQDIGVEPVQGFRASTLPGKHLTLPFKVTNSTLRILQCTSDVRLPQGWKLVAPDTPFDVASGSFSVRLLTFAVPAACRAGEYQVVYRVNGDTMDTTGSQAVLTVNVLSDRRLVLRALDVPRFAIAGDAYTTPFALTNEGNVPTTVTLKARSVQSDSASTDSLRLHMGPGEQRTLVIRTQTPFSVRRSVQDVTIVNATAAEDSLSSVTTSASTTIVPRAATALDLYHRFPVRATLRGAGENERSGIQAELMGRGSLDEPRSDCLDFFLCGPDLMRVSTLGPHDEYRVSYQREGVDAFFGDQVFRLTPLTEYGRFAFGGGASIDIENITIGGFYNRTRWTALSEFERAGSITYRADPGAEVSLNYMAKSRDSTSSMLSLRTRVNPFSTNVIDLEYSRGFIPSGTPAAISLRMNGREDWGYYDVQYLRAEPGYTGYYTDVDFVNGNLIFFPYGKFRVEALIRSEMRNLDRNPRYYSAPHFRFYQFGAGYGNYLTLYYKTSISSDELPLPRFDTRESSVMAIASYGFPFGSVLVDAELGRTREDVQHSSGAFSRLALFSSTTIASAYTLGVNLQYGKDYNLYTNSPTQRFNGGLSVGAYIGRSTWLLASGTLTRFLNHASQWYSIFDASLHQQLPWGHEIALRGRCTRYNQFGQGTNSAWLAEYSVPLDLPVAKKGSIGQLRGKLLDTESGMGIRNVLISVDGSMAVTDESGEFFFPTLAPGVHDVTVDQATLGYERVLTGDAPTGIPLRGGDETKLTLGVVRAAQVSGTVRRFEFENTSDSLQSKVLEAGGQPGVLIELRNQERFLRQLTDSRGRFEISGVQPGDWKLKVLDGDIPEHHYFEEDSLFLRLAPGQKAEITLKLLPKRRKIQLLEPAQSGSATSITPPIIPPARQDFPVLREKGKNTFSVQLTSYPTQKKAREFAKKAMKATGKSPSVIKRVSASGKVAYLVSFTGLRSRQEAESLSQALRSAL